METDYELYLFEVAQVAADGGVCNRSVLRASRGYIHPAAPAYAVVALPPSWGGFYAGINGGYGGNSGLPFREDVINPPASSPPAGIYSRLSGRTL